MKRRSLLQLLAAGALTPAALAQQSARGVSEGVLVLVELRGGNDGLNTVVPWRDPLYRQARPRLAIDQPLPLANGLGLHPALAPIEPLWRQGRLSVALGVGWPEPNRSHFKAMDQWSTGSASGQGHGWVAQALDQRRSAGPLLALGPTGSASLEGGTVPALQMAAENLRSPSPWLLDPQLVTNNPILRRMLELESTGARELARIQREIRPLPSGVKLPSTPLGQQVGLALRLLATPACPPVLALSQTGFDTHANQVPRHESLLRHLAEALQAFDAGLAQMGKRPRVLLLAVSEFGRRLRENGSRGTDHGSASVAFLYGDPVGRQLPHPWIGTYPSLGQLDPRGDLISGLSPDVLYRQVVNSLWG
ncbi:MAG: DUF1501 domain-containing protein [Cyanobacteriota bacterium]|nr:DUF1501 domain-containing protein [Cyanobacteriota bacterium]